MGRRPEGWFQARRPVFRFVGLFGLFMGLFYAATFTPLAEERAWPAYLRWNAEASGSILRLLGQAATVEDRSIRSPRSALLIERGCDAVQPSALFVAAVLASPVVWWSRVAGMVAGTVLLMLLNLVRIVTLYFAQIHFPRIFETLHVEVWQALFIFLAVLLWVGWAAWALRQRPLRTDASP